MVKKTPSIETEATILKRIDRELKDLSPDVRKEAFQILVARHLGGLSSKHGKTRSAPAEVAAGKQRGDRTKSTPAIVKHLNLKKEGNSSSLRDFYAEKQPGSFLGSNALFVYYLSKIKELAPITPNHIYTCYKEVSARVPGAFYQSLVDTSNRQGWIDTKNGDDIQITIVGENFVEHDLPKKKVKIAKR